MHTRRESQTRAGGSGTSESGKKKMSVVVTVTVRWTESDMFDVMFADTPTARGDESSCVHQ